MTIGEKLTSRDQLYGRDSIDLLARTLYGETENDSASRVGVAYVVSNRKNATTGEFKNLNTIEAIVLQTTAFSCFWDDNLAKCLAPDTKSAVWTNCLNVATNTGSFPNPVGDKLFYTVDTVFNSLSYTENGVLYYKFPSGRLTKVVSKILVGKHMLFNYVLA